MMPWYDESGSSWLVPLTMTLGMILFWSGAVIVVVVILRHTRLGFRPSEAERLLAERFARGEIDEKEYTKAREVLRAH